MGEAEGSARDALAGRLRALREGSGRTYASLARRVGVSGSTLHRYCTGRTVPSEFAPVERLARLCGAPGEEREALHRLWLLADAERLDRQEAGPVAGRPSAPPPEPPSSGEARPADGEGGPPPSPDVAAIAARPGPRPRWARRHGRALAALAGAALVLAVLVVPTGTGPREQPTAAQPPGASPGGAPGPSASGAPALPTPRGTARGGPPATPPGGPGTSEPKRPHTVGPRPGALPGPSTTSRAPGPGGTPLTWTSDDQVWKNGCGHSYLVDRSPSAVPPPPVEADAGSWARKLGAVHAGETGVRITVQGRDERAVVLEALHIRVVERRSPAAGRVYRMSSGCGGALTPRAFDVDLDAPRPVARSVPGNDSGEPIEALAFPYRVSASDPEVLLITGRTVGCDCDWVAELTWSSGGLSGTVRLDDGGRPFRTSGVREPVVYDYDTAAGRWREAADADDTAS
ncbi:helix-turn-helix domain-containing protein [Streptomyces pratensis]|uniref:helix-turn-helix domain-containing protein n=1 Tax=Streptomyces pratensis TaxID=1169025 RepID=UPI0030158E9E